MVCTHAHDLHMANATCHVLLAVSQQTKQKATSNVFAG